MLSALGALAASASLFMDSVRRAFFCRVGKKNVSRERFLDIATDGEVFLGCCSAQCSPFHAIVRKERNVINIISIVKAATYGM